MGAQNVVSLGFNVDELSAEKQEVLEIFKDLFGKLQEYDGSRFNPLGGGGLGDLKKSLTDGATAMAGYTAAAQKYNDVVTQQAAKQQAAKQGTSELGQAMKAYQQIVDQLATTQAKNNAAQSDAAEGLAAERVALSDRNKELTASARLQAAETDSIGEAKAANAALTIEKEKLNLSTEEGKARLEDINAEMDKNTEFIKANASAAEAQRLNIGNYSGSLAGAFDLQKEQLIQINKQLAEMETRGKSAVQNLTGGAGQQLGFQNDRYKGNNNVTGQSGSGVTNFVSGAGAQVPILKQEEDAFQRLTVVGKIYEQSIQRQTVGFKTANQELRDLKNTLDALELAGYKNTAMFDSLNRAYTSSEQKVKDLHREQAILTTDAPGLTALTGVARGLGGVYAASAGAAGLLADGNEHLEKELNQLVAVMTFLQGLQEASSVLKQRNAIVTALETEATKALAFIKGIEVRLFGEAKVAVVAETVAKEANVAASVESAEATTANTVALEAEAGAATTAASATGGLRTVLAGGAAAGIAAAAIGAGVALALLTAKLIGYGDFAGTTAKQQQELAEAVRGLSESLEAQAKIYDELDDSQKRYYTNLLSSAQAAGASVYETLLVQQRFDKSQAAAAKEDIDRLDATDARYSAAANAVQRLRNEQGEYNKIIKDLQKIPEKDQTKAQKRELDAARVNLQTNKIQVDNATKTFEDMRAAREKFQDFTQKASEDETKFNKLSLDDQLAVTEKAEELRATLIKAKNALILSDDRSTLAQRLAAIKSNAAQEINTINAQADQIKGNPSNFVGGLLTPQAEAQIEQGNEKRKEIAADSADKQYKLIIEYADRELAARVAIQKNELESDAANQDAITKNTQKELDDRLGALHKNIDDKTAIIVADYHKQLALAKEHGKTDGEIAELSSNKQKALVELTANTQKQIYDITISYGEARLKAIEEQNKAQNSSNAVTANYAAQEKALDDSLGKNLVADIFYNEKKKALDEKYAQDKADADIKDADAELKRLQDFQNKKLNIDKELADIDLALAKKGGNSEEIANAQAEVDALQVIQDEADAKQNAATDKKNAAEIAKEKAKNDKVKEARTAFFQNVDKLGQASFDLAQGLVDASYEKQIQKIELETQRQDAASDETIAAVQRSKLSTREQAEEETILAQQKRARDSAAAKEVRQEKVAEARFDRDMAVARAIWAGAAAEIAAIWEYSGTPYAFGIAAVIAATTAIEVATILAKPIPAYAEGIGIDGKGNHPGGLFVAGEAGPERVTENGESFIVNKPTLLNAGPGLVVEPLTDTVRGIASAGMMRGFAILNAHQPQDDGMEMAIREQTTQIVRQLRKNQRQTIKVVNNINITEDASTHYKIYGKRK